MAMLLPLSRLPLSRLPLSRLLLSKLPLNSTIWQKSETVPFKRRKSSTTIATPKQPPPGHHTIKGIELRLQQLEVVERAESDTPYFKLWVNSKAFPADQLAYIDTSEQRMLYNPITNDGSYKSNLSIVMVMKREQSGVYTLSSVVLPNNNLMRTGTIIKTIDSTIYDANFQMGASTKFTFIHPPKRLQNLCNLH
ncbi:uncharacterized protein LOC135336198 isoform X2 [Halichondria panicea]|uniref:uncharacterized protein LOC135336198 isoform X2 n=1 Tax=Halichondria panicea TaxID=6063 RepID=UPI00312B3BA1